MLQIFRINMVLVKHLGILYFFGYKMGFFSFPNNPKNLDLSYKADIDLSDCLGRVKLVLS